ncbi:MAG: electron transfer flavoprotein subunit beta/FixA family protein [archaeon]|nr:electron transfer flavoprotein subunit beta/FixA family protein [archaeon]
MKYVVFVKQVPDTTLIAVDENGNLIRAGVPSILDPYSEHALETAVSLKKEGDLIVAVTMGPDQAQSALRRCLEIGADEAYLLSDRAFAGADVHATARTLSAFVEKFAADASLIMFGKQAADGDTAQVPAEVAEMLGREQFCYCVSVNAEDDHFVTVQDYGDERRTCRAPMGSVVSVSEGDINRRLPSIARFIEASEAEIKRLDRIALGLGNFSVGMNGSRTKIVKSVNVRSERLGKITDGSDPVKAAAYLKELI